MSIRLDISIVDELTGGQLTGAEIDLLDPSGKAISTITESTFLGGSDPDDPGGSVVLEPGNYLLVERKTPCVTEEVADDTLDEEGNHHVDKSIATYEPLRSCAVRLEDAVETQQVVLAYKKLVEESDITSTTRKPSRQALYIGLWLAGLVAMAVVGLWLVVPLVWMTVFGLVSFATPSLGFGFAFANLIEYFGGYLFSGWAAIEKLSAAYHVSPALWYITIALCLVGFVLSVKAYTTKIERMRPEHNTLLESLPPTAGHNELGSARFVQDPKEIRENLETCGAYEEDFEYAGPVLGCVDDPMYMSAKKSVLDVFNGVVCLGKKLDR